MHKGGRIYGTGPACRELLITDAAYIAGLIDGEGCIGISYRRRTNRAARFQPCVAINITDRDVLRWMAEITGLGAVLGPFIPGARRAETYRWSIFSWSAASLLIQICPFLKIKRANAELLIAVDADLRLGGVRDADWVQTIKQSFHELNAKGPRGLSPVPVSIH